MANTSYIHESPITRLGSVEPEKKCILDPIHGPIELEPVLIEIVNTPQFQRLRDIKQLGGVHWVYPGATHTRFEHSIGTCYLSGLMIETLKALHGDKNSKEFVEITKTDVLCVKIAALCHDLGHGPFSHFFYQMYIPYVQAQQTQEAQKKDPINEWKHEKASVDMFHSMLADPNNEKLREIFKKEELGKYQIDFIKDLILGRDPNQASAKIPEEFQLRCKYGIQQEDVEKWFIYEIVANKRNGIDCDKFDYLLRDCHYVGMGSSFEYRRYFQQIRIMRVDGKLQVCVRDKEIFELYLLFSTRWSLHHRVYQHKTKQAIEHMLVEAFFKADEIYGISKSIECMTEFMNMTDSLVYRILADNNDANGVIQAKRLLLRIQCRDLYKLVGGQIRISADKGKFDKEEVKEQIGSIVLKETDEIIKKLKEKDTKDRKATFVKACYHSLPRKDLGSEKIVEKSIIDVSESLAKKDDLIVDIISINFGMKGKDPVQSVQAYGKDGTPYQLKESDISEMLPKCFQEKFVRVYVRESKHEQVAAAKFLIWCENKNLEIPRVLEGCSEEGYITPGNRSEKHGVKRGNEGKEANNSKAKRKIGEEELSKKNE